MSNKKLADNALKITIAAMMTAISVVVGIFCKNYMNFASGLFRITFENLPILITGIVYGPVVGGIVGVASDLVGYLFSAQIYPPNPIVTLGAAVVGITAGVVAKYIVRKKGTVQIICSGISAHVIGSMIVKSFGLYQFYGALVLWRIPTYILISATEITVICILLRRKSFATLIGYI